MRLGAGASRSCCVLVQIANPHTRVAPDGAYAYAKSPLREGPLSWLLQRRCSVAPGPERLVSRLMQQPQAHHSMLHVSEGLPAQFAFNDAKSREETDAGRLVDQEHGQTVVKSRHQQLQPDRSYLQACCNSNASVSPNRLSSL